MKDRLTLILSIAIIMVLGFTVAGCNATNTSDSSVIDEKPAGESEGTASQEVKSKNEEAVQEIDKEGPEIVIETDKKNISTDNVEAVVSSHKLATEAGFEILAKGGTAADAAIAVAAVLSIVEPYFSHVLGGGTWALYYSSETGQVTSLDGVGPVGSKATVEDYSERADLEGMHKSIIPGAWDGWMLWLDAYGNMDLGDILAPAINIAREGYPASSAMETWLDRKAQFISSSPDTADIYIADGRLLRQGNTVYQNDIADTFEALIEAYDSMADQGRDAAVQAARDYYYRGPLAEAIVEFSDNDNGYLTIEDFNDFQAEIVEPVSINYNDEIEVFENPPNSQGITMLLALNVLKGYDFSQYDQFDPDAIHLQVEALKLAFADRHYHIGDPELTDIPIDELLSDGYAGRQRDRIDMENIMEWPIADGLAGNDAESNNTTTFHITDKYGNAAAVTTSLGAQFLVIGDTGIHINNRMRMISLEEGNPNQLTPGYKVRHTSCPYMVLKNGKPYILGGNTGVDNQPQAQLQQFLHVTEFGLTAQESVDSPRFATTSFPAGTYPYGVRNILRMSNGFPQNTIDRLRSKGHSIEIGGAFGSANMIVIEESGLEAQAGADPNVDTSYGMVESGSSQ
jgi:gamma-glutamyltranspeptidase / glutathione hydrolase